MSMLVVPAKKEEVTKIICPDCGEKVKGVGLLKGSRVDGLVFRCKKCGAYKEVKSKIEEPNN